MLLQCDIAVVLNTFALTHAVRHARVHHFKKYPCCFTGADAVKWFIRSGNAGARVFTHEYHIHQIRSPMGRAWCIECLAIIWIGGASDAFA